MSDPDHFESAPAWWLTQPWPLPEPMDADTYQREAIESAQSEQAQEAARQEFK